jgi:flagellar basal-body rod protein FlgB
LQQAGTPLPVKRPSRILFGFYSPKLCRVTGIRREAAAPYTDSMALSFGSRAAVGTNSMLDRLAGQLERYMDLLSARQKLVASNIANADTPGYHTRDIDFQSEFQSALGGAPQTVDVTGLEMKNDGNNVNLDRESRLLAENALRFNVASSLMKIQIQTVRAAIKEGQSS